MSACGNDESASKKDEDKANAASSTEVKMGRANYAAHGDKSFAVAVVAMEGDTIVGASMDEFQFMDKSAKGVVPVPNADGAFGEGFASPDKPLASKLDSTEYYSEHMAEEAGSTKPLHENYAVIEDYVTGKTVEELEKTLQDNTPEQMVDEVSGATLVDTFGYVSAFVEAAKNAK